MANAVLNSENVTHYIFNKKHFDVPNNEVLPQAFIYHRPEVTDLSVIRISDIGESDIWDIGINVVGKNRTPSLKARADMLVSHIRNTSYDNKKHRLDVEEDPLPHPLHANIKNISTNPGLRQIIALKLSNIANLMLRPK